MTLNGRTTGQVAISLSLLPNADAPLPSLVPNQPEVLELLHILNLKLRAAEYFLKKGHFYFYLLIHFFGKKYDKNSGMHVRRKRVFKKFLSHLTIIATK